MDQVSTKARVTGSLRRQYFGEVKGALHSASGTANGALNYGEVHGTLHRQRRG